MQNLKKNLQQNDFFTWKLPELIPCGCSIATDLTCQKIIHNPFAAEFYGIKPWSSLSFTSSLPPQIKVYQNGRIVMPREMPIQRSAWYGDENNRLELEFIWPDGVSKTTLWSTRPLKDENGVIIGAFGIFEDITELITITEDFNAKQIILQKMLDKGTKQLQQDFEKWALIEREITREERLNVFRQLSASLAHEVRNPMTTIRGFLQLLQNKTELLKYESQFNLMMDDLDNIDSIITDFSSLARRNENTLNTLNYKNLNDLLINLFPILQAKAFSQGKKIVFELGNIAAININSNEITQLVLNLTRNGLEAMPQDGCLRIKTFGDNQTIVLSVTDEGTGIIPEDLSKLGTLFFTTKEKSFGLGIPMCYDIADRHRAKIEIQTSSSGTTVLVRFPYIQEQRS